MNLKETLFNRINLDQLDILVLDFETTNINFGDSRNKDNHIVLAGWKRYDKGSCVKTQAIIGNEYEQAELLQDIEAADFCVAHNSKFEYGWLNRCGLPFFEVEIFCTQIAEYVILGNRKESLKLDDTATRRGLGQKDNLISILLKGGVCPSTMPEHLLAKYCIQDCNLTYKVLEQQLEEIYDLELERVLYTRLATTPVLAEIESRGMRVDRDKVYEFFYKYQKEYDGLQAQLDQLTGGINLNSPKQVAGFIYEDLKFAQVRDRRGNIILSPAGNPKTDTATLMSLKATNKTQRMFIKLISARNKANALLTKNLNFFKMVVDELPKQIFYANLNQTVTKTHRLSSTGSPVAFKCLEGKTKGIQFQNIPRDFKELFIPKKPGWVIIEPDYGQLEFRVPACICDDIQAKADIKNGVDVHRNTADTLTAAGEPTDRQGAKKNTFAPLFGKVKGTPAETKYFQWFKERYSGITSTQNEWKDAVEQTKQLRTASGLIFYWPDTRWEGSSKNPYLRNTTAICNFPVQSFATEIVQIALVLLVSRLREEGLQSVVVNTVHDSFVIESPPEEIEKVKSVLKECMQDGVYDYLYEVYRVNFDVELAIDIKVGTGWGMNNYK